MKTNANSRAGGRIEFLHLCDSDRIFASSPYLRITTFPHLGMLTLAAILRRDGYAPAYHDRAYEVFEPALWTEVVRNEPLFIGIYSNIALKADAVELIRQIRTLSPQVPILVGGPGFFEAKEYFQAGANAVVAGMADLIITAVAGRLNEGRDLAGIPGVLLPGMPVENNLAPFPEEVDDIPFPAWDLAPPGRFHNDFAFIQKNPWYVMLASRGCPYHCHFCSQIYPAEQHRYRLRSVSLVLEEMRQLQHQYGVRHIKFQDDAFGGVKKWLREFCEEKIRSRLPVQWNCSSIPVCFRGDGEEVFRLMKQAGCTSLHFGLQTTAPELLRRIGRNPEEPQLLAELLPALRRAGLYALVDVIVGLPGESRQTIENHSRFLNRLPVPMIQVFPLQILPNTRLGKDYPDGKVTELSREEIHAGVRHITRRFMLRPITLWRNMAYILRHHPGYLLTLLRLSPYLFRLALGRYRMAEWRMSGPAAPDPPAAGRLGAAT